MMPGKRLEVGNEDEDSVDGEGEPWLSRGKKVISEQWANSPSAEAGPGLAHRLTT